jgi:hypothetical protein
LEILMVQAVSFTSLFQGKSIFIFPHSILISLLGQDLVLISDVLLLGRTMSI